ncbi:DUF3768 domain-containing protein [Sphingobium xenophagum]|uniref:DUF3768 domain-containing protein n=1 Tax=Sphingobium xenophagum TaxID=121428 RepID=A0A401IY80_SPHXE|nr:DUF3768 domain-containing protein [Sphingobium xenophagum]GBH29364.1 hypothetical protein MBESOW_P0618 [Sphingobium xenophagum]
MADMVRRAAIARLNDRLRITGLGGSIFMTAGIAALPKAVRNAAILAVRHFSDFNPDNDPHGEHDCAVLTVQDQRIIWKIDYYPRNDSGVDPDPADPATIKRVLTIMLAGEY